MKSVILSIQLILLITITHAQHIYPVGEYTNTGSHPIELSNLAINNNYLLLPLGREGFQVLDLSDIQSIKALITYTEVDERPGKIVFGEAYQMEFVNNKIYLAFGDIGFKIMDFADPTMPYVIGSYYRHESVYSFTVKDNIVFLGLKDKGLEIIDVSNIDDIKLVARNNISDYPVQNITLIPPYVLLSGNHRGLRTYTFEESFDQFKSIGFPNDFTPGGDILKLLMIDHQHGVIANDYNGIQILNFKLPTYPLEIGKIDTKDKPLDLALYENYLIVAEGKQIEIFDIADAKNPKLMQEHKSKGKKYMNLLYKDNFLYVGFISGSKRYGVEIFQVE